MDYDKMKENAPVVLRIGLSLVFLWFGLTNLFNPEALVGYLSPVIRSLIPFAPTTFMILTGVFEVVFGILLLLGLFTRLAALLFTVHVIGVAISLGYNDIAIRDIGLAVAAFTVFLHGRDKLCLDNKLR
jgi:uncharacterized membrane protein YphA (DoxX/SURF4 family)